LDLGDIVASKCRQKILRVLSHVGEIRIMKLVEKTGCDYNEVMRNLRILEHEGFIIYRRVGRKCIVSLNRNSCKTRVLVKALRILDTPIDSRQPHREVDNASLQQDERLGAGIEFISSEAEDLVLGHSGGS